MATLGSKQSGGLFVYVDRDDVRDNKGQRVHDQFLSGEVVNSKESSPTRLFKRNMWGILIGLCTFRRICLSFQFNQYCVHSDFVILMIFNKDSMSIMAHCCDKQCYCALTSSLATAP